jgi:beta-galactosidase
LDTRAPRPLPPCLDWMRFHEALLCASLAELAASLGRAGLAELPLVHNLAMGENGQPTTLSALGRSVDLVGLDYYHRRTGAESARKRTLRLAGSTQLAFAPELGVGAPPWFAPRSELDSLLGALWACAYGLRGFNLYMAVEREQWYGAPIDADGEPRAQAERWQRLIAALRDLEFHRLTRRVEVGLCIAKEYAQLSRATHTLGALSPSLLDLAGLPPSAACRADRFGFEQPIQLAWEPLLAQVDEALCAAHVPFVYVEGEVELDPVAGPRLVFAPSFEFADPERWQRLQRFAQRGGRVVWGPQLPSLDLDLRPCEFQPLPGPGPWQPRDPSDADAQVGELCLELGLQRPFAAFPRPLRVSVHEDPDSGEPRVLFVLNPSALPVHGELRLPRALRLVDALTGERFQPAEASAIPMAAWACRMLIVEKSSHDQ